MLVIKNVRIIVPDNTFPDNAIQYTPFDMDFESPFEVQIVKEDFEKHITYLKQSNREQFSSIQHLEQSHREKDAYLEQAVKEKNAYFF